MPSILMFEHTGRPGNGMAFMGTVVPVEVVKDWFDQTRFAMVTVPLIYTSEYDIYGLYFKDDVEMSLFELHFGIEGARWTEEHSKTFGKY
jgi:hypothetical protein